MNQSYSKRPSDSSLPSIALIFFSIAPFVFGCQPPWASGFLIGGALVLCAFQIFISLRRNVAWGFANPKLNFLIVILLAWLSLTVIYDCFSGATQGRVPAISFEKLIFAFGFTAAAVLGASFGDSPQQIRKLLKILTAIGLTLSCFALLEAYGFDIKKFAGWTLGSTRPSGVYTNANRFAVLLSCIWFCGTAALLDAIGRQRRLSYDAPSRGLIPLTVLSLFLISISIALTLSRLTIVAVAVSLLSTALVHIFVNRRTSTDEDALPLHERLAPLAAPVAIVLAWGVWCLLVGNTNLRNRFADLSELTVQGRSDALVAAWPLLNKSPFTGLGLGTFESWFTSVQPINMPGRWRELHNDWLQLSIEAGAPATLLMLIVAALTIHCCWNKIKSAAPEERCLYSLPAAALSVVMICSAADFPLREPATAMLVFFVAGALCAPSSNVKSKSKLAKAFGIGVAILLLGFATFSLRSGVAYATSPWAGRIYPPPVQASDLPRWQRALAIDGSDPELHFRVANAALAAADGNKTNLELAKREAEIARSLQPLDYRFYWIQAVIAEKSGRIDEALNFAQDTLRRAPTNPLLLEQTGRWLLIHRVANADPGDEPRRDALTTATGYFRLVLEANPSREAELIFTLNENGALNSEVAMLWPGTDDRSRIKRARYFCDAGQLNLADRELSSFKPAESREIAWNHAIKGTVSLKREEFELGQLEWLSALSGPNHAETFALESWLVSQLASLKQIDYDALANTLAPQLNGFPRLCGALAQKLVSSGHLTRADNILKTVADRSPDLCATWAEVALQLGDTAAASRRARQAWELGLSSPNWGDWYDQFLARVKQKQRQ